MVKLLRLGILFLPFIFSCEGETETLPAYIHIEKIDFSYQNVNLVGNGGTAITDAWIYNNGNLLGVFELPTTIAVAAEGTHSISVSGGIKLNGISATREPYRFYEPWVKSSVSLSPLDTTTLTPTVKYYFETGISFIEEFQDVVLAIETSTVSDVPLERFLITEEEDNPPFYLDNYVGRAIVTNSNPGFKAFTKDLFMVPTSSSLPIYLELDYKCNQDLIISTIISNPGVATVESPIIALRSTVENGEMTWNHIYIDLTDFFAGQINAEGFGIGFTAYYNKANSEGYIFMDNVKVVNEAP